jgi:hypothetical protein
VTASESSYSRRPCFAAVMATTFTVVGIAFGSATRRQRAFPSFGGLARAPRLCEAMERGSRGGRLLWIQ